MKFDIQVFENQAILLASKSATAGILFLRPQLLELLEIIAVGSNSRRKEVERCRIIYPNWLRL